MTIKSKLLSPSLVVTMILCAPVPLLAREQSAPHATDALKQNNYDLTLRFGAGGFRDKRSPIGELGGDQLALDIKPKGQALAFSISTEYYTNSPNPSHPYEISDLFSFNILFMSQLLHFNTTSYFVGGGVGVLKIPKSEIEPGTKIKSHLYNLEAGIHLKYFERVGFYGLAKYLFARKRVDNVTLIDFNEVIVLVGITYNFTL